MSPPSAPASPAGAAAGARAEERGFSLVGVLAGLTISLILTTAAMPTWRYVMKNAREEELIFRGNQIAEAIERYQRKHGGAPPTSLEVLVKGRFLRKEFTEPMTRSGKWRLIRSGEAGVPGRRGRGPGLRPGPADRLRQRDGGAEGLGGFVGVASTSEDKSLRIFNGRTNYNEWLFVAGQPRVVGRQRMPPGMTPGAPGTPPVFPGAPGVPPSPSPLPER